MTAITLTYNPATGYFEDGAGNTIYNTLDAARLVLRQGTRTQVQTDGGASKPMYVGELFYDKTDGHIWISNGTSQVKIDTRAIVSFENEPVFFNDEAVLF